MVEWLIRGVLALASLAIFVVISVSEWNPIFAFIGIVVAVIFLRFGRGRRRRRHGGRMYFGWDDGDDGGGWFDGGGDGGGNGGNGAATGEAETRGTTAPS